VDVVNVISIDPGINHCGFTVAKIDRESKKILSTATDTIHVKDKFLNKKTIETYGIRQAKIDYINEIMISHIELTKPAAIVIESPFYNFKRPAAFMPLVELLYQIRQTLRELIPDSLMFLHAPSTVKKIIGAPAHCHKEEVKIAILEMKDKFNYEGLVPMEDLDEHSIDSLAVLYAYTQVNI